MKFVIYKSNGDFCVTTKENYNAIVQNAREIVKVVGFKTAEEIIEYYCKNIKTKPEDFIVIKGESRC